jgi:hypothetical protein
MGEGGGRVIDDGIQSVIFPLPFTPLNKETHWQLCPIYFLYEIKIGLLNTLYLTG